MCLLGSKAYILITRSVLTMLLSKALPKPRTLTNSFCERSHKVFQKKSTLIWISPFFLIIHYVYLVQTHSYALEWLILRKLITTKFKKCLRRHSRLWRHYVRSIIRPGEPWRVWPSSIFARPFLHAVFVFGGGASNHYCRSAGSSFPFSRQVRFYSLHTWRRPTRTRGFAMGFLRNVKRYPVDHTLSFPVQLQKCGL